MQTPQQRADEDAQTVVQAQGVDLSMLSAPPDQLKAQVGQTLGHVVPILRIDFRPTNVDPQNWKGVQNMKRVLNAVLNDDNNRITAKDEGGKAIGVKNFNEIYPQVREPASDGSIEVEYHEQATLSWVGDVLWAGGWFFRKGILGVPQQTMSAILQAVGVSFLLEAYYQQWLKSLLDHLNQRGVVPGYVDPDTGRDNWEIYTAVTGRNIIVRPIGKYRATLVKE